MAVTKILYRNGGLRQAIDYITNPVKTDENLLTDYSQLKFIAMGSAIYLYPEPTTKSVRIKLRNELVR